MNKTEVLLKNLALWDKRPALQSVEEWVAYLSGRQDDLEAIHIWIDLLDASCWRKKEYFHIRKYEKTTSLDEWIYAHLVDNEEYGRYLDCYRPQKDKLGFDDIDEYIMDKHYRPRAAAVLRKEKRHFRLKDWTLRCWGLDYERRSNLTLHDGLEYRFDFRGPLETLFVLKEDGLKKILVVGGFGSSGGRLNYTLFAAIFYLLGRQKPVRHHLILYDRFNRFKFLRTYRRPLVTVWLGMNYPLDKGLAAEIRKAGVDFSKVQEKFPGIK